MSDKKLNMTGVLPEPDRWIRLHCYDWSKYHVIGKRVMYKSPPNKKGSWRFMGRDSNGRLIANQEAWKDCEGWEYCSEDDSP